MSGGMTSDDSLLGGFEARIVEALFDDLRRCCPAVLQDMHADSLNSLASRWRLIVNQELSAAAFNALLKRRASL